MLVIDKKIMKLKEAGLPQSVIDNTPKMMRRSKLPIVKAKVGPQIVTLVCDQKIFDLVPVKKEVKATVSGIYLTSVKAVRGTLVQPENQKKKNWFKRNIEKLQEKAGAKPAFPFLSKSAFQRSDSPSHHTRSEFLHPVPLFPAVPPESSGRARHLL